MDQTPDDQKARQRNEMIERHLIPRGIRAARVLEAMRCTPRERFVPSHMERDAYDDRALPIEFGQTISQPYMVAYMTQKLNVSPSSRVLEIGTGSGYQTAVLARLCRHIYSVERLPELHQKATAILGELNVRNATLVLADGSTGLPSYAPFDRIIITAAAPSAPESLLSQLADGGRMILPTGGKNEQTIIWYDRRGDRLIESSGIGCRFVRLVGAEGWRN